MFKYSNISLLLISFLVVISISNCTRDFGPSPVNEGYSILPPSKLPWPHQKPDLDINDYNVLIKDLWIINNFGQYQGGDTKESLYFHDGLDIVLDNGTKIYSIVSGYVRYIHDGGEYYSSVIIEDEEKPLFAWIYSHVYNFQIDTGEYVPQGNYIADINFQGLPHIHLFSNRI